MLGYESTKCKTGLRNAGAAHGWIWAARSGPSGLMPSCCQPSCQEHPLHSSNKSETGQAHVCEGGKRDSGKKNKSETRTREGQGQVQVMGVQNPRWMGTPLRMSGR